jgi:protein-S-isoprenylcysteine O-methyltransferase Ste14
LVCEKYYQRLLERLFPCLAAGCNIHETHRLQGKRSSAVPLPDSDCNRLVSCVSGTPPPVPIQYSDHPQTGAVLVVSSILCVCGLGFCLWARATLGRNWSGTVTLKENHELIMRGPYRLVRHPIYTGLLAMLIATAIQQRHIAGVIGLVLVFVSFWIKLSEEELVMLKQFPGQYAAYRQRVKRIIPFVL